MNQETIIDLVQGHQQRVYETCRREAELARHSSGAVSPGSRQLRKLAEWLRPARPSIGFIQLTDLEDWS